MTISEVKQYLLKTVAAYYGKQHTVYANVKKQRLPVPYITLRYYGYKKSRNKITKFDVTEQCYKDYWNAKMILDVNLYTAGRNVSPDDRVPVYEDTSVEDLADFIMYLESDFMQDDLVRNNVAVELDGEINNLSALVNDNSAFNYRAMASLKINFIECSYGKFGQNGRNLPNSSGGGNEEMQAASEIIETIIIKGGLKSE